MAATGNSLAINMGALKSGGAFALVEVVAPSEGEGGSLSRRGREGAQSLGQGTTRRNGVLWLAEGFALPSLVFATSLGSRGSGPKLLADTPVLWQPPGHRRPGCRSRIQGSS